MVRIADTGRSAADFLPADPRPSLRELREAAAGCRGCDLWKVGTQTVFGEGPAKARVMFVGEQPGDQEDRQGHPFVGPAGAILDKALQEVGISRDDVYVTNAVKHFKWVPRGKRRLHAKPNTKEVKACRPWFEAELAVVKPEIVVALGATAAQMLMGAGFRITRERGTVFADTPWAPKFMATVHPSSILRAPEEEDRRKAYAAFVEDLRVVAAEIDETPAARRR